ncbi:MAG: ATP-binding protein, partial [Hyphomicrobiaceae bacterium]
SERREAIVESFTCSIADHAKHRLDLASKATEADHAANLAVRDAAAWSEQAPSFDTLSKMQDELESLRRATRQHQAERERLREELRSVEGGLQRDAEDGVEAQHAELDEQRAAAAQRLDAMRETVAALEMLERELAALRSRRSATFTAPVAARMKDIGGMLFPDVSFGLDQKLAVASFTRNAVSEPIAAVSDGTREQISLLARLAYAGLLAEKGGSAPLILDDALVFSDDERLGLMFDILQKAAHNQQIILLTCHERAFQPLLSSGTVRQLQLVEWTGHPMEVA